MKKILYLDIFNFNKQDKWLKIIHPGDLEKYKDFHSNVIKNKLSDAVFDYKIIYPEDRVVKLRDKRRVTKVDGNCYRITGILSVLL